jgi:gliding-associated putative ABC transporter substrate-binding component GldG
MKKLNDLSQLARKNKFWVIVVCIFAANLILHFFPVKIDTTAKKTYTLSQSTKQITRKLDDIVNIKVYASESLPPQYITVRRYLRDLLNEYKYLSNGKIRVDWINPEKDDEAAEEAQRLGIPKLQFSDIKQDKYEVTQGFLGLAVKYEDDAEIIPFIEKTNDLEYQLTSKIYKLTRDSTPRIGFTTGHGEETTIETPQSAQLMQSGVQDVLAKEVLKDEFTVEDVKIASGSAELIEEDFGALVVLNPGKKFDKKNKYVLDQYLMQGKPVVFLLETKDVNENMQISAARHDLEPLLNHYGFELQEGLLLDASSERVNFNMGQTMVISQYPFWVKTQPQNLNQNHPATANLQALVFPWSSPVEFDQNDQRITSLIKTSEQTWMEKGSVNISPTQEFVPKTEGRRTIAAILEGELNSYFAGKEAYTDEFQDKVEQGKLVLVGDADFIRTGMERRSAQNAHFFVNLIEYLTAGKNLGEIRVKAEDVRPLVELSDSKRELIKYGNIIGVPLLVSLIGFAYLYYQNKKEY